MEKETENEKVLILISGGVIQSVYANDKNIEIDILDLDNEEFNNGDDADKEINKRSKDLIPLI